VVYRFKAPVDWHLGEVTEVAVKGRAKGTRCKHGQVKAVYQSGESHGQGSHRTTSWLSRGAECGVQGDWVILEPEATAVSDRLYVAVGGYGAAKRHSSPTSSSIKSGPG
jgi:hypothetical protein